MDSDPRIVTLLTEIRDDQRQLLAEYTRVANQSLALQQQGFEAQQRAIAQQHIAVDTQLGTARLYRIAVTVAGLIIALVLWQLAKYL